LRLATVGGELDRETHRAQAVVGFKCNKALCLGWDLDRYGTADVEDSGFLGADLAALPRPSENVLPEVPASLDDRCLRGDAVENLLVSCAVIRPFDRFPALYR
jgi:hypothetical protein